MYPLSANNFSRALAHPPLADFAPFPPAHTIASRHDSSACARKNPLPANLITLSIHVQLPFSPHPKAKIPTVHPNPTCSGPAAAARRPGGSAPDGCSSSGPPTAPAPPPHPPTAAAHLPRWSSLLLHCLASEGLRSYFPSKFVHLRQPLL